MRFDYAGGVGFADVISAIRSDPGELRFAEHVQGLPGGIELMRDLERTLMHSGRRWSERSRKEIGLHHYKMMRSESDSRRRKRKDWKEFLGE